MLINSGGIGNLIMVVLGYRFLGSIIEREEKMAIRVIITRKVERGRQRDLLPLLMELRTKAVNQKGYISGETLRGIDDPEEFLVISTWNSYDDWKAWEGKPERMKIQAEIDTILEEKTIAKAYLYG